MGANALGEDVQNVNVLTVNASESYDSFAKGLQTKIAEAVADRPRAVTADLFVSKVIKDDKGNEQVMDQDTALDSDRISNGGFRSFCVLVFCCFGVWVRFGTC